MELQPYLAEFLRRSPLPLSNVAIKIASLEYRWDVSAEATEDPSQYIVPFDDKRSIRRIILTRDHLPD